MQPTVDKGTVNNVFNEVFKMACNFFGNKECLGICKMLQLRAIFKISPTVARDKLSKAFCKAVYLGQFVCMDEKMKKWRGRSPYIKKVLAKKNDPVGHWTTQVCVNFACTSEPFIIGLYPFASELEDGVLLETRSKIWGWLLDLLRYHKKHFQANYLC